MSKQTEQNPEAFMELGEALEVVYDLAEQNALDLEDMVDEGLQEEAKRQDTALRVVHDYIVNQHGEED